MNSAYARMFDQFLGDIKQASKLGCFHKNIVDVSPAGGPTYEVCEDCHEPMFVEMKGSRVL